jgi:23S rRNA pseudouridine1911/1915/1917 synthase
VLFENSLSFTVMPQRDTLKVSTARMLLLLMVLVLVSDSYSLAIPASFTARTGATITVPTGSTPARLDYFLPMALQKTHTRSHIAQWCDTGCVVVNGKVRGKSFKVKEGDVIVTQIPPTTELNVLPENIPLEKLYEDSRMLIVNKPAGMVVHPAVGSPNGTFVNAFLYYLGTAAASQLFTSGPPATNTLNEFNELDDQESEETDALGTLRPGVVHRLDKGTSGCLVAGKTAEAVSRLSAMFADRQVRKIYVAVCVGNPGDATIRKRIGRSKTHRQQMVTCVGQNGKPAISHVRTLAFDGKLSVCLVRIETGR